MAAVKSRSFPAKLLSTGFAAEIICFTTATWSSGRYLESLLGYVISPSSYSLCAQLSVFEGDSLNCLAQARCKSAKLRRGGGCSSTTVLTSFTIFAARPGFHFLAISCQSRMSSWLSVESIPSYEAASTSSFDVQNVARTSWYGSGTNACIAFSRSATRRRVGVMTLPTLKPACSHWPCRIDLVPLMPTSQSHLALQSAASAK
mmetsp:Transcript_59426/g.141742  ORF Transcript_59426/g.141742 Transcript_59426/m.141742 type:complete len:203 (-) Transcript_59426:611-1219(-)